MKAFLKISLLLNLGLVGGLICMLLGDQKRMASPPPQPIAAISAPVNTNISVLQPVQAITKPFCWSQLVATDYHVFVKNLRAIGCPEPIVRAIVTADVNTVFRWRGDELEKKLDDLSHGSWTVQVGTYNDQQALKAAIQQLPGEEAAMIDDFLGLRTIPTGTYATMASASRPSQTGNLSSSRQTTFVASTSRAGAGTQPGTGSLSSSQPAAADAAGPAASINRPSGGNQLPQLPPTPKNAALPVVFQPVDQTTMNLTDSQMQAVNDARQSFLNSISGSSQDPNDSAYQQNWQQAQSQSDSLSLTYLGYNLYMKLWTANYQNALASQTIANSGP
jgi:hypothetical protein